MAFEENKVLFGHDPETRIVAVELDPDGVTVFTRAENGETVSRSEPFEPFLWMDEPVPMEGVRYETLTGEMPFGQLARCENWKAFSRLRAALRTGAARSFAFNDPVQQYLTATGKTLFKGMQFAELRRLQLTVETFCAEETEISCAARATEHLMAIALSDESGWQEILLIDPADPETSELRALERLETTIRERDPDVIEGHDLFKITLPYLAGRAKRLKRKLSWGRNGAPVTSRASRLQIAERTLNYPKAEVYGRHFVDTYLLTQFYDITARELESYTLADVADHFHLTHEEPLADREKPRIYLEEPERLARHLAGNLRQTRELSALLSASYFVQAEIFPYGYQDVTIRGNATKINALFLREYLRQGHGIPDLPVPRPFEGGYTDIFYTGVARDVVHCDIASLYPSVMLEFDCFPIADRLAIFRDLLCDLRKFRFEAKTKLRQAAGTPELSYYAALQSTFKILLNSFYGYLGFAQGHFADFDAAARVTQTGRDLLRQMVEWLQKAGAQVVEIDTDGIYFVPPAGTDRATLQKGLAAVLPPGIEVEFDAEYRAMFSYKAKNYALLDHDGELTIRGGALRSRGLERFQRAFLEAMIRLLLEGRGAEIPQLHAAWETKIRQREWPIEFLMKNDTLQDSLAQYSRKIEGSARNRAAAYELALKSGRRFEPGDAVSYYITGEKKKVSAYESARLVEEWNPEARDENVEYYAAKLGELLKKFQPFIEAEVPPQLGLL